MDLSVTHRGALAALASSAALFSGWLAWTGALVIVSWGESLPNLKDPGIIQRAWFIAMAALAVAGQVAAISAWWRAADRPRGNHSRRLPWSRTPEVDRSLGRAAAISLVVLVLYTILIVWLPSSLAGGPELSAAIAPTGLASGVVAVALLVWRSRLRTQSQSALTQS